MGLGGLGAAGWSPMARGQLRRAPTHPADTCQGFTFSVWFLADTVTC